MNRREFIHTSAAGLAAASVVSETSAEVHGGRLPAVISSSSGLAATARAMRLLRQGRDTLDAVVAGVNIVEEDPEDMSVGYGGLPNEKGIVQLDASVMHGPTRGAAGVAALEEIRYASRVAQKVMENTDHVLLVGQGALEFAVAMGFERENLLTPAARERWMAWKQNHSDEDHWINPEQRLPKSMRPDERRAMAHALRQHGTINCNAVNEKGEISGVTTTSGMAFKIPGRVGDSPIIGAGLYVDNEVGACGSTGRGEANLKTCASFLVVEFMRQGSSPEEACLKALQRIVENTAEPYLLDTEGRPNFGINFYAINKKGEFAGASMWSGVTYAAHDGSKNAHFEAAYLYKRP